MIRLVFTAAIVIVVQSLFAQNLSLPSTHGNIPINTENIQINEKAWPDANVVYRYPDTRIHVERNNRLFRSNDVLASKSVTEVIYPEEFLAFEVNLTDQNIGMIRTEYVLSQQASEALNKVPDWLYKDLVVQFRLLNAYGFDDEYADLINTCDENIIDEVAFQIAHLPIESLTDSRFRVRMDMLVKNAAMIYNTVDSLKYVRLKEYGIPGNGDYYTTTEYRIQNGENSTEYVWEEIPRDIYYWYVVHPKVFHEGVYELDKTNSSSQRTYGYFWREYIWYNPDPVHDYTKVNKSTSVGTVSTIPRFGELIQQPDVLWDRKRHFKYFNRPFGNDDHALDLIGNWASKAIPVDAQNPRAVQPNQALYEHNGNCGEDSYLLVAACRTALIPVITVNTSGEDHVWAGIWDENKWNHFEFFRGGLANSGWGFTSFFEDGNYESSGWRMSYVMLNRPDGYKFPWTKNYTETSVIKLKVTDKYGFPVDGAKVVLWCKPGPYYNPGWQKAGYIWTDHYGYLDIEVGDYKTYGFQIDHPDFGMIPSSSTLYPFNNGQPLGNGQTYEGTISFPNAEMPGVKVLSSTSLPAESTYGVRVDFGSDQLLTGTGGDDVQNGHFLYKTTGAIQFFICDKENFEYFKNGETFHAYENLPYVGSGKFDLTFPMEGVWYVVFANKHKTVNYENLTVNLELIKDAKLSDLTEVSIDTKIDAYPNPFNESIIIDFKGQADRIEIIDNKGRLIETLGNTSHHWKPGADTSPGLYYIRVFEKNRIYSTKVSYSKY